MNLHYNNLLLTSTAQTMTRGAQRNTSLIVRSTYQVQ